jgi:hypothetical protein
VTVTESVTRDPLAGLTIETLTLQAGAPDEPGVARAPALGDKTSASIGIANKRTERRMA